MRQTEQILHDPDQLPMEQKEKVIDFVQFFRLPQRERQQQPLSQVVSGLSEPVLQAGLG